MVIAQGNVSTCISACSSGYNYDSSALACIKAPTETASTNIVSSTIPPYTFLITSATLIFLIFIIKFKYPSTNISLTLFLALQVTNSAALGNLLYTEIINSGILSGNTTNVSVSTALLISSAGVQMLSSVGVVIMIVKVKDPELLKIWLRNPITFLSIMILSLVDSNLLFITSSQMLNISCFQAKMSSIMIKIFSFGLVASLFCKLLNLVYSAMQLLYYGNHAYRLLTSAVNYPI